MPPKAPQNRRNRQCPLCHTWVTTAGFGRHVQHCKKWDQQDEGESAADHETSNDESVLIDHISISTISELDSSDNEGAPDPPDANFDMEWEAEAPLVNGEDEEELEYQKDQVYDDDDDDDWWNEYCVPQSEPTIEEEDEDNEEFEELLHWMDNELDREIGENNDLLLTAEDKQNIKMFAIKNRHNITNLLYSDLRNLFYDELHILTAFTLQKRVMKLAGWKPERHDMCINSCMAFTGAFKRLNACIHCDTPRKDERGRSTPYHTLPLAPQLSALYSGTGGSREAMNYTKEMLSSFDPSKIRDIHDGSAVRSLIGKKVVVNGKEHTHSYFADTRDIPLGMMTDGFQCFKRARRGKSSAWPVILINYGRPGTDRMRLEHIIPFSLIPGPNQPKDFNSFLFPLKVQLDGLAAGIQTYDSASKELFQLHAYLVAAIGDMQAVKHFSCMKGPGAVRPCRVCYIKGVYHRGRRKYYVPLTSPNGLDPPARRGYTPTSLPLRTTAQMKRQLQDIQSARNPTGRTRLAKDFGVNGESVLSFMPGFNCILGYPHEYMHLLFENIIPMLVCLWKGNFREVDNSEQPYLISQEDWEEIGRLTVESNRSIPSFFSRPIPNIHEDLNLFTAEAYAFWFMHMAPTLLRGRFSDDRYYRHTMLLVKIVEKCLLFEITHAEIDDLEYNICLWVTKFEKYYYQYDMSRIQVCTLPVHALLHVPYDIRATGPVSGCWSWVMERFCGILGIVATKGRRFPNTVIANRMHQHALVLFFDAQYNLGLRRLFRMGRLRDQDEKKTQDPGYIDGTDLRLSVPSRCSFVPDKATRRQIAKYFPVIASTQVAKAPRIKDFEALLPYSMTQWNKIQILNGGDRIRALDTDSQTSLPGKRDNSFVRFTLFSDKNAVNHAERDEPMLQVLYGRLRYIVEFEFPAFARAGADFDVPKVHRLACIQSCKLANPGDATLQVVEHSEMQDTPVFVHIGVVECAIGRVKTPRGWSIVDRSSEWARTVFTAEDVDEDAIDA